LLSKSLLKELEEFASRGCPDLNQKNIDSLNTSISQNEHIIEEQKRKQKRIIEELKLQLQDLESYAYEVGAANKSNKLFSITSGSHLRYLF
jgi:hypothetical protein